MYYINSLPLKYFFVMTDIHLVFKLDNVFNPKKIGGYKRFKSSNNNSQ